MSITTRLIRWPMLATIALAALWPVEARALGGPFITDDAEVAPHLTGQLEAWVRNGPGGWETWVLPAAIVMPNLELTLGTGAQAEPGAHVTQFVLQGKRNLKPIVPGGWGVGVAAGWIVRRAPDARPGQIYAYVPLSVSLLGDRLRVHPNLGYSYDPANERVHELTWNLGAEGTVGDRWLVTGEIFGDTRWVPTFQGGLRYWIAPELTRLDMTVIGEGPDGMAATIGLGFYGLAQPAP